MITTENVNTSNLNSWLKYGAIFSLLWILLTEAEWSSWLLGAAIVPIATWCAIHVFPRKHSHQSHSIKLKGLLKFIPFFSYQSLKGGWESAMFALLPMKKIQPGFFTYTTSLPKGNARLLFMNTISLLPGTLSANLQGENIVVHALDTSSNNKKAVADSEQKIFELFGIQSKTNSNEYPENEK